MQARTVLIEDFQSLIGDAFDGVDVSVGQRYGRHDTESLRRIWGTLGVQRAETRGYAVINRKQPNY